MINKSKQPKRAAGIAAAIKAAGGLRALARLLKINHQAILQWSQIPAERMLEIERLTGMPRELLRPDLYRHSLIASNHPLVRNDVVAGALDGFALILLGIHRGIPLESFGEELDSDTALGVIVNRVLAAPKPN